MCLCIHKQCFFQRQRQRQRLPFEVVLPHKDIGHPSPSWRRPGQPTNTHISSRWWWLWLWWWWWWCQPTNTNMSSSWCCCWWWWLILRMMMMFIMMIMMVATSMMMTLIDLALVPPFCQVTVCQKKTFSFSSSFFDKQTGDCLPTKTLSFLFLNFKRRLSVKKKLYNFCSWIKKVTVCKKNFIIFVPPPPLNSIRGEKIGRKWFWQWPPVGFILFILGL